MVCMYTKLHVDHRSYYVCYFYEHLTTGYACWIDNCGPFLNGSLFFLLFSGFFMRLWVSCALSILCFLSSSWRFLWHFVAFLVLCCISCGDLWLFVILRLFV